MSVEKSQAALRLLNKSGQLPETDPGMAQEIGAPMMQGMTSGPLPGGAEMDMSMMSPDPSGMQMEADPMAQFAPTSVIPGLTINNDQMSTMIKYGVLMQMQMGMSGG